ncbi:hypothetical protein LEM8419_02358 [Neolewinella maritima]|uniref:Secretion system C-terminal sorting domain-containing protein n=1 Tax=Neolewinella maritima TaxID=1383882 RepID=A0ABN8F8A1_9BACT|nr:T9SS type A sorting domain-containing protein [Neolewinella maritima]CAH1001455.1 hypothetical protein LEM8419_02358 [Neolewinella maritima]
MFFLRFQLAVPALLLAVSLTAQTPDDYTIIHDHLLCDLPAAPFDGTQPVGEAYVFRKGVPTKAADVAITYFQAGESLNGRRCVDLEEGAQSAFDRAVAIWVDVLRPEQQLNIDVCFTKDLSDGTLGQASTSFIRPANSADLGNEDLFYPKAVYEQLVGSNLSGTDMSIYFNADQFFYYGEDEFDLPAIAFDFTTLAVHELGHGLGFSGKPTYSPGNSSIGFNQGQMGDQEPIFIPTVFDRGVALGSAPIAIVELPAGSQTLDNALLGREGGLFFDQEQLGAFTDQEERFKLYTPDVYNRGSSYSHLDDAKEVMYYRQRQGAFNRNPGNAAAVMQSIGWAGQNQVAAPVELLAFTATADDAGVLLRWTTSSETENAGFTVEASPDGTRFAAIGEVAGQGTTTETQHYSLTDPTPRAGTTYYRLRQTDFDGTFSLSDVVSVDFVVTHSILGNPYPNPSAATQVTLDYTTEQSRTLTGRLYGITGQVLRQWRQDVGAGRSQLTVDLTDLSAGVYLLQLHDGREGQLRRLRVE